MKSSSNAFLIDGFPRALDQAQTFEAQIQPCDMVNPATCILFPAEKVFLNQ